MGVTIHKKKIQRSFSKGKSPDFTHRQYNATHSQIIYGQNQMKNVWILKMIMLALTLSSSPSLSHCGLKREEKYVKILFVLWFLYENIGTSWFYGKTFYQQS